MDSKEPEGGKVGSAQLKSYTYLFSLVAGGGAFWLARRDLGPEGDRMLSVAFGVESNMWIWACLLIGGFFSVGLPAGFVSMSYADHTGLAYVEDRIGYAKSGGSDIAFWSGFLASVSVVFLFGRVIPPGFLGGFRPFALLLLACITGCILSKLVANRVFGALFGPPRFRGRWLERR